MPQLVLDKGFQLGLRHTADTARNGQALVTADNVKTAEQGLVPWTKGFDALPAALDTNLQTAGLLNGSGLAFSHLWPQIINSRSNTFIMGATSCYEMNESTYALTQVLPTSFTAANVVVNGTFTTNLSSWSLSGAGVWVYDAGRAKSTGGGYIYQSAILPAGAACVVTFSARATSVLTLVVSRGGAVPQSLTLTTTMRRYQIYLAANASTELRFEAYGANIYLDDVEAYAVSAIPTGNRWHIADFGPVVLMFNGACTLMRIGMFDGSHAPWAYRWYIDTTVNPATGCNLGGRLLMGGFSSNASYASWITAALTAAGIPNVEQFVTGLTSGHVWWSSIGADDMLRLFNPTYETAGPNATGTASWDSNDPAFEHTDLRNQSGHKKVPYNGNVLCIKQLGGAAIVYTTKGVGLLQPVFSGGYPTFSFQHLVEVGVSHRDAIGGNDDKHYFIDTRGTLWAIGLDFQPRRLGYEEYLSTLDTANYGLSANYHADRDEVYLSSGNSDGVSITFVVTPDGISRALFGVAAIGLIGGDWVLVVKTGGTDGVTVETDVIDFGNRGVDTLKTLEVGATANNLDLVLYYRTNKGGTWTARPPIDVSRAGKQQVTLSATEFRLRLTCPTITDFTKLDYVILVFESQGRKNLGQLLRSF